MFEVRAIKRRRHERSFIGKEERPMDPIQIKKIHTREMKMQKSVDYSQKREKEFIMHAHVR